MSQIDIQFENVIPSKEQVEILFDLLKERQHRISCEATDYIKHEIFVKAHPYRSWYLIKFKDIYVGSFYVSKENTIGINVSQKFTRLTVSPILKFVKDNFEPFPSIPSVRSGRFAVNVPLSNTVLAEELEELGATIAQKTYFIPN